MQFFDSSLRRLIEAGIEHNAILPLFSQILDGVEAAHKSKVIHRDLKPENILYDSKNKVLAVADFGIARFQEEEFYTAVETKAADRLANFQYAAPEQRSIGTLVDERTDIYALGLILNEMFTKEIPLGTGYRSIGSINKEFSYLDDLVSVMLRQSPNERPASVEVIKRELIGRRNDFISLQHLSNLKKTVIPVSEIDDPLIVDPPRILDFNWKNKLLTINMNQTVNPLWVTVFRNMGSYSSLMGKGPERFTFESDEAKIGADEREVQEIISYFKSWLPQVNQKYANLVEQQKREKQEKLHRELQAKIDEEEAKARVRKSVRI